MMRGGRFDLYERLGGSVPAWRGDNNAPQRLRVRHFAIVLEIARGVAPAVGSGVQGLGAVVEFEIAEHAAHIEVGFVAGEAVAVFRTIPKIIL
jgi:hypothetical protein